MKDFQFNSYNPEIKSSAEVAAQLRDLGDELAGTTLAHVLPFNKIYLLITDAVVARLGSGYFKDDDFINGFDVAFAYYYLDALRSHIDGRPVPPAWDKLFWARAGDALPEIVLMALGVNAHVNNDIPQVLLIRKATRKNHADFLKVNDLIKGEVAGALDYVGEQAPVFKLTEKTAAPAYHIFMKVLIVRWRANAWKQFEQLKSGKTHKIGLEKNADNRAKRLSFIKDPLLVTKDV